MFKKIFAKIFAKKSNKKFLCSINFEVTKNNTLNVSCYWPNFDDTNSEKIQQTSTEFATLIHLLNSGFLKQDILRTLNDLTDKTNIYDQMFVNSCLSVWLDLIEYDKSAKDFEPIIKPSIVFKQK